MNLQRVNGHPITLQCSGCHTVGVGGSGAYTSAQGESTQPGDWYQYEDSQDSRVFCSTCGAKLVEEDPTRSVTQFYSDTAGTIQA